MRGSGIHSAANCGGEGTVCRNSSPPSRVEKPAQALARRARTTFQAKAFSDVDRMMQSRILTVN